MKIAPSRPFCRFRSPIADRFGHPTGAAHHDRCRDAPAAHARRGFWLTLAGSIRR